ncbi:MAG: DUF1761 domain-containing protein [Bacteroidota bacterium]
MEDLNINWMALVVAAIVPMIIGFIWYNPKVFGIIWMRESGMTEEKARQMNPAKTYGLALVFAFILATAIWPQVMLGGGPGEEHGVAPFLTFKHGAFHGALLGLLIVLPVFATNALFEQKSFKYVAINVGYWIVTLSIMGGIINVWQ